MAGESVDVLLTHFAFALLFMPLRLLALLLPLSLVACAPLSQPASNAPPVSLAQEEKRECKKARVVLPPGVYTPEVQSERGIYYVAPTDLRTERVMIGGSYRGGLFVANEGWHAAWFGDARDDADERPGTLLGAVGASAPKLWPFSPPLPVTPVNATP